MPVDRSQLGDNLPPVLSLKSFMILLTAISFGAVTAAVILPDLLPGMAISLLGTAPKAYWFLSRGSAIVSFILLWVSMALGIMITNKMAQIWPGGPRAFDLHQFASLLGMAFALFHALILLGDRYINFNLAQILVPFSSQNYRPVWVGLGQLSFYAWGIVNLSFYVRRKIGNRAWRLTHYAAYVSFSLALVHGIASGTDSSSLGATYMYWTAGSSLLFLSVYRILVSLLRGRLKAARAH